MFPDCNSSLNCPVAIKWCTKFEVAWKRCPIVFSCDQAALWMVQSVCLSIRHTFFTVFHHCIIMKFSWLITDDKSDAHAKGQGQRSKAKVTEVKTRFSHFRTIIKSPRSGVTLCFQFASAAAAAPRRNDFCLSCQNCLNYILDIWGK